ncbi:hypothetical protein [Pseudomonas sp. NA-150]|uniref:hypothetical protein n=1 Tax=Pseudomonas sp. NA-150 TaxID=3367525 RepID=UPI0037C9F39F
MKACSLLAMIKYQIEKAVRPARLGIGFVMLLGLFAAGHSAGAAPLIKHGEIQDEVTKAVSSAAAPLKLGIDPRITAEIASDASLFVDNFCLEEQAPCEQTIFDPDTLQSIVGEYLKAALNRPSSIETVASRLATRVGKSMSDAGWPSSRDNSIGLVEVPEAARDVNIFIQTATEQLSVGASIDSILLSPGKQVLVAKLEGGESLTGTVDVAPRGWVTWKISRQALQPSIGRIEADLKQYCEHGEPTKRAPVKNAPPGQEWPLDAFNWGRVSFGESAEISKQHTVAAARQAALDITVNDETNTCADNCREGLGLAFAKAVAIWRSGCLRCTESALAVIRLGSNVWLDMRAVDRLRTLELKPEATRELDLAKPAIGEVGRYFTAPGLLVDKRSIVGYEQIDQDKALIDTLCAIPRAESPDWAVSAQGFLCAGATAPTMDLRPVLTVKGGWTDCGVGAIACGLPGGEVQITVFKYVFSIPTPTGTINLGDKSVETVSPIDRVVLHEVGHWFGIPHPNQIGLPTEDIMLSVFNPQHVCVTAESLTLLNNATDDRWYYRAKEKEGLMMPANYSESEMPPPQPPPPPPPSDDDYIAIPPPPPSIFDDIPVPPPSR